MVLRAALTCGLLACIGASCSLRSAEVADRPLRVAVTASFAPVHMELARRFSELHAVRIDTSVGSTGRLFAQIENGAPFDLFLAADQERPRLLEEHAHAVVGSRFTYAEGRLALYSSKDALPGNGEEAVRTMPFSYLAIADPELAPYGVAARQVLEAWGLWHGLAPRMVRGTNVAQALHFVESGSAELGLVAWPLVYSRDAAHVWPVPTSLHAPIRHDAVQVRQPTPHPLAAVFLGFLHAAAAQEVIAAAGYGVGARPAN